jgi:hypothetical protein
MNVYIQLRTCWLLEGGFVGWAGDIWLEVVASTRRVDRLRLIREERPSGRMMKAGPLRPTL